MTLYRGASKDIAFFETLGISSPTKWLADHSSSIHAALQDMSRAGDIYAGVRGDSHHANLMRQVGSVLQEVQPMLEGYTQHESVILRMLGDKVPQRYIVFNQNRDEIRANGGFPGSIISFTLYKGNVMDYRTDDVYYYDWNLYPHQEQPPPGISLLTNNYGLRDVNYYPDFLETLQKANAFVERTGDSTLTTGIAIHQGIIEDILKIT